MLLFLCLLLLWFFAPLLLQRIDQTVGNVDQSIWLLIILSLISFLLICGLWLVVIKKNLAGSTSSRYDNNCFTTNVFL